MSDCQQSAALSTPDQSDASESDGEFPELSEAECVAVFKQYILREVQCKVTAEDIDIKTDPATRPALQ